MHGTRVQHNPKSSSCQGASRRSDGYAWKTAGNTPGDPPGAPQGEGKPQGKAEQRVESNKGAPGVVGMITGQLREYLRRHWEKIKAGCTFVVDIDLSILRPGKPRLANGSAGRAPDCTLVMSPEQKTLATLPPSLPMILTFSTASATLTLMTTARQSGVGIFLPVRAGAIRKAISIGHSGQVTPIPGSDRTVVGANRRDDSRVAKVSGKEGKP